MADANPVDKGKAPASNPAAPSSSPEPKAAPEQHVGTAIPKAPAESVNETFKPAVQAQEAHPGPVVTPRPEHLTVNEGDSPERKEAVEAAKKASAHPVTQPGTPAPDGGKRRPTHVVSAELAEARAKLDDMIAGKNTAPDTPEITEKRKAVNDLKAKLRDEEAKLGTLTGANVQSVHPDDLHAQHYAVKTLEDELKGTNPAGPRPPV